MKTNPSTTHLLNQIANTSSIHQAIGNIDEDITLPGHLQKLLASSGVTLSELGRRMLVSRSFVYQIMEGIRRPGRDMLLRMAFSLALSFEETQRLLAVVQRGALYPRVRRDAALIFALQNRYTLMEADEALLSIGEQPLLEKIE